MKVDQSTNVQTKVLIWRSAQEIDSIGKKYVKLSNKSRKYKMGGRKGC